MSGVQRAQQLHELEQKIAAIHAVKSDLERLEQFLRTEHQRLAQDSQGLYAQSFASNQEVESTLKRARELERKLRGGK
jgi:hypothetical protein